MQRLISYLRLFTVLLAVTVSIPCAAQSSFELRTGDIVGFLGGTNLVNLQRDGTLEARMTLRFPDAKPRFRDFCWEGDTVFEQRTVTERWRKDKFGDLRKQLDSNKVTVVIINFGQSEALAGIDGLDEFRDAYEELLSQIGVDKAKRRAVLISPIPFEKATELLPDLSRKNDDLWQYVGVIRDVAKKHDCLFVDLFSNFSGAETPLTSNGIHISPAARHRVADAITNSGFALGLKVSRLAETRKQVTAKHQLWMDYWRPQNWKCIYGDDGERNFGKSTAGGPTLREEWSRLPGMIAEHEERIWKTADVTNAR